MTQIPFRPSRRSLLQHSLATASFLSATPAIRALAQTPSHAATPMAVETSCHIDCGAKPIPVPKDFIERATPKFDTTDAHTIAGLRPHRTGTYLLTTDHDLGKHIVHNYGHGGAGITMSWGCAMQVLKRVRAIPPSAADNGIAVLGCGVMGLTAAITLKQAWPRRKITIYSDTSDEKKITSYKAGGQWCPASVEHCNNDDEFRIILKDSYDKFLRLGGPYGVSKKMNFTIQRAEPCKEFNFMPSLTPETAVRKLPFRNVNLPGFMYQTLLVEPPIFLKKLRDDLAKAGVPPIVPRTFKPAKVGVDRSETIFSLSENIIINCTGLGSKDLFNDPNVRPIKGQLILLPPQPDLTYLFSGYSRGQNGDECNDWVQYLFPRKDAVVIGGTYEHKFGDDQGHKTTGETLVRHIKSIFEGQTPSCVGYPNDGL